MRATGSAAVVKMCQEAVWGTTPPSPAIVYGLGLRSETLGSTKNLFESEMINAYRAVIGLGDGNKAVAGGIVSDLIPEGLEVLFKHLLGNGTIVTTGSGPYTHVITGNGGWEEGLSIEKGFTDIGQYLLYKGCRLNSMTLNLIQEGFHDITFDFVGKEEASAQTSQIVGTPVFGTKNGYTGYECVLSIDSGSGYVDITNVVSGSITIGNSVETDGYVLGSQFRRSAVYNKRVCEGTLSAFFEDLVLYNLYINGIF